MRYFLHLAYDGSRYHGWQRQANSYTIQEVVEKSLGDIMRYPVPCFGCGRTDAGVHASQYFAQINIEKDWDYDFLFRVNKVLPDDISVFDVVPVNDSCNVRLDATERTYDYFLHLYKDAFLFGKSAYYDYPVLDVEKMAQAATLLPSHDNFRSLCLTPLNHTTTICKLTAARVFVDNRGDRLRFQFTANRFIRGMIRILVAKLLDVGRGKLSLEGFCELLTHDQHPAPFNMAYPQGLYLTRVKYPYIDLKPRSEYMQMMQDAATWSEL